LQKKKKLESSDLLNFQKCISDQSAGKIFTHHYQQILLESSSSFDLGIHLQKKELVLLCKAYEINTSQLKRSLLSNILRDTILSCDEMKDPSALKTST
jgi:hypothetical protein